MSLSPTLTPTANIASSRLKPNISYNGSLHIKQLDAVRGWAILLVLVFHFYRQYFSLFNIGWTGVDLFFVLSGFLITGILYDAKQQPGYFRNFYIKRVLRIFPIYFLVLSILFYLVPLISTTATPDLPYYLNHQAWFWTYLQNWLYSIKGYPNDRIFMFTWSLCIEEQFYLFWPLIIYKASAKNIVRIAVFFIIMANVLRLLHFNGIDENYIYVNTFSRIDALSVGALIAILVRTNKALLEKLATPVLIVSLLFLLLNIGYQKSLYFMNLYYSFSFIAFISGTLLVWSLASNMPHTLKFMVNNKALFFLGKYSYGIYLYHVPLYLLVTPWLISQLQNYMVINTPVILVLRTVVMLFSIAVAVLSFKYIETPFLNLKKKLVIKH